MDPVTFRPIGIVRTPFTSIDACRSRPSARSGYAGRIELDPALANGLADLDGFSHLVLLYHLHRSGGPRLAVTPFLDTQPRGIFATRSPARPTPIGLSTVRLVAIAGTELVIEDVDMLDGTPLLDIKPYVPAFDDRPAARIGWFEGHAEEARVRRADRRFG